MGFDLTLNFRLPYVALNPSEFWERWHISLSSWLRDYLYIPLGGNRKGARRTSINLMITMILGGLWHGAAWNFVAWGTFHGVLLVAYRAAEQRRPASMTSSATRLPRWLMMFTFTCVGWVLFRSPDLTTINTILSSWVPTSLGGIDLLLRDVLPFVLPLIGVQWWQWRRQDLLAPLEVRPVLLGIGYGAAVAALVVLAPRVPTEFIYFQF